MIVLDTSKLLPTVSSSTFFLFGKQVFIEKAGLNCLKPAFYFVINSDD